MNAGNSEEQAISVSYKTVHVLLIFIRVNVLSVIEKKKCLRKIEKIHCHLKNEHCVTVNQIVMTTVAFW